MASFLLGDHESINPPLDFFLWYQKGGEWGPMPPYSLAKAPLGLWGQGWGGPGPPYFLWLEDAWYWGKFLFVPIDLLISRIFSFKSGIYEGKKIHRKHYTVVPWTLRSKLVYFLLSTFLSLLMFVLHLMSRVFSCTSTKKQWKCIYSIIYSIYSIRSQNYWSILTVVHKPLQTFYFSFS